MARNLKSVVVHSTGYIFTNPTLTGTAITDFAPFFTAGIDGSAPPSGWSELGHTDAETPLTITREGGDLTTITTWQGGTIEDRASVTFFLDFTSLQLDLETMQLFFGGGSAVSNSAGYFDIPKSVSTGASQQRQLIVCVVDGAKREGFYTSTASIAANGSISGPAPRTLPLRATLVSRDSDNFLVRIFQNASLI